MSWKIILSFIFFIVVFFLLFAYWMVPLNNLEFVPSENKNYNFSISNLSNNLQFYENMRFPDKQISYFIEDCPLDKRNEMETAFDILSNLTSLGFYEEDKGQIEVTCESKTRFTEGNYKAFIAGEGGPTNITSTSHFNVIKSGSILLLRTSKCPNPNIGVHELLHVLGFEHSSNPNNIMYNFSRCDQEIGEDTLNLINELYSYPSRVDLALSDVSANLNGHYLNANLTIRNEGLKDTKESKILIYADGSLIEELEGESLEIGFGRKIILRNKLIYKLSVNELTFEIQYDEEELNKENNVLTLEIKK